MDSGGHCYLSDIFLCAWLFLFSLVQELNWHCICGDKNNPQLSYSTPNLCSLTESWLEVEFTLWLQLYSGLGMNGVGAYWSTDHMFGVPSRIVSKYTLREPELELRAWIAQLLDGRKRERKNEINSVCQRCLLINQLNAFGKVFTNQASQCLAWLSLQYTSTVQCYPL